MSEIVNYNEISSVYNVRYEVSPLEGVLAYLKRIIDFTEPKRILEVGCGTAHWLKNLAHLNSHFYGCDLSIGMLKQSDTRKIKNIHLINSDVNSLPIKNNTIDAIICVNAIHHFGDKKKFIIDSTKILKKNGILSIIGLDPRDPQINWSLYKYFDRTYSTDIERFPSFNDISIWMEINGFYNIEKKLVHQINKTIKGRDVLNDHFLDKRGASQLSLLKDQEYQQGISKIKHDIECAESESKEFEFIVKLNFYAITGIKK